MPMRRALITIAILAGAVSALAAPTRATQASARTMTIDNNASCDIGTMPAATLLLPYFEVEFHKPVTEAGNTIFTIVNTSKLSQVARVTIWTDQGYPAAWFHIFLTGYDVQPISLYDVLAIGRLPQTSALTTAGPRSAPGTANPNFVSVETCNDVGGTMPAGALEALQTMLTTGIREGANCRVGGQHAMATGYVTVDLVNGCSPLSPLEIGYYSSVLLFDNVLTGDYERINPESKIGNYAGGNPLVHIKAIPEGGPAGGAGVTSTLPYTFYDRYTPPNARKIDRRQPLPSTFAARFIQGGTAAFQTDYAIWREGAAPGATMCVSANAAMPLGQIVRFDEQENATTLAPDFVAAALPTAAGIATSSATFPPMQGASVSGWMYLDLDNHAGAAERGNPYSVRRASQNWVIIHLRAEGRYGVDYDATSLANGCTPPQAPNTIMVKRPEPKK